MSNRREFIKAGAIGAALAATGLPATSRAGEKGEKDEKDARPLDILVLGGTGFIGDPSGKTAERQLLNQTDLDHNIARLHTRTPDAPVVIQADRRVDIGLLVQVMDQVRLAGIRDIAIAAETP